ncbi:MULTISPECIES: class V lanthionine synthetase subunit LxmK [Streptomyces]|uniref:class V lanthionine synthetase subunit LxmK n=1 Tax=Streptomyces TaxID=1883 RepID=UPI0006EB8A87|nr:MULTISPECIES: class V lanthionine synthetase subunit LxmK [Streptomyces]
MPDAEIAEFIRRAGYGEFLPDTVVTFPGRNQNVAGTTTGGTDVFAKRIRVAGRAGAGLERAGRFEQLGGELQLRHLRWPTPLASDASRGIHVTHWLKGCRTAADAVADGAFGPELARRLGQAIGELHSLRVPSEKVPREPLPMPDRRILTSLSMGQYLESSAGLIALWRIVQGDAVMAESVQRLREDEKHAPAVPIHADLRLDQILVEGDELLLSDWEEFRRGDGARDVGAVVGEFLFRSIVGIADEEFPQGDGGTGGEGRAHDEIMTRGVRRLEEARPTLTAFAEGYRSVRSAPDDGLAVRAVAFAGWHLFDRVMAAAAFRSDLSPVHRAAAGVGRTALVTPAAFVAVLGMGAV